MHALSDPDVERRQILHKKLISYRFNDTNELKLFSNYAAATMLAMLVSAQTMSQFLSTGIQI